MSNEENTLNLLDRGLKPYWLESRWISKKNLMLNISFSYFSSLKLSNPTCSETDEKLKIVKFGAKESDINSDECFSFIITKGLLIMINLLKL